MLPGISNTIRSLPVASMTCAAIGLYLGRNWCAAGFYKTASLVGNVVAYNKAVEWNQTGNEYLTLAKKDGLRNVAAAASLIAIGLASGYNQEKVLPKEEESKSIQKYLSPVLGGVAGFIIGGYKVAYQGLHSIKFDKAATFKIIIPLIFARTVPDIDLVCDKCYNKKI